MTVRIEHVSSAAALPPDLFDRLDVAFPLSTIGELDRVEGWNEYQHRYLVAVDDEGPAAFLPVYALTTDAARQVLPTGVLRAEDPGGVEDPGAIVLLLGNRVGNVNHLAVRTGLPAVKAAALVAGLLDEVTAFGAECGARTAVLLRITAAQYDLLPATWRGREPDEVVESAYVDVAWEDFEGYTATLPTKRRSMVRVERDRFREAAGDVRAEPFLDSSERLAPLLAQVEVRYNGAADVEEMARYLKSTAMGMGDRGMALILREGEREVAFSSVMCGRDEWYVRAWGCDYANVASSGVYFNLTIIEPLVRAAAAGVRRVHLGTGSLDAKRRRGAKLQTLSTYVQALGDQ